jgi:hypothetical protein
MSKQEYFGLAYSLDTLKVSQDKSTPKLSVDLGQLLSIDVREEKDLLFENSHFLNIVAVSRAVTKRIAVPILGSTYTGLDAIIAGNSVLEVERSRTITDTNYYLENNNLLVDLKVLNAEGIVDEIPTIISSTTIQQPFWS